MGSQNYGIDTLVAESVAAEIRTVHDLGIEVAIVVGGGNIFRGVSESAGNMDRAAADYIGMLATVMNAVMLQDALEQQEVYTRVMSAIDISMITGEPGADVGAATEDDDDAEISIEASASASSGDSADDLEASEVSGEMAAASPGKDGGNGNGDKKKSRSRRRKKR